MRSLALGAALALAACAPRDTPPDAVYRAFARAASERDAAAAWPLLSARTRAWLDARARAAAAEAPGLLSPSGQRLLFGDAAARARPLKEIAVLRSDAGRAELRVADAGGAVAEVVLVREGGGWRIDLPER
jgi:hypothetical protein